MPDPESQTFTIDTRSAALPREGEGVDQSDVIAIQRRKIATLWGEIEKRDRELAKRDETIAEQTRTITSLRTQLAHAEVTVSAVAADLLGWPGEEFADLSDRLRAALASPSPGPGAAEPDISPLARLIRAADSAVADHYAAGGIGRVVEELREAAEGCRGLADLDATEVKP